MSEKKHPGLVLQENAEGFFNQVFSLCKSEMACRAGCDGCCHALFSIFQWEASFVEKWFKELPSIDKERLISLWRTVQEEGKDALGEPATPCPFLYHHQCSIYSVRPIICRTQGLPLLIEGEVDSCPLNFKEGFPERRLCLDLERLNTLSALLAQEEAGARVQLVDLKEKLIHM